MSDMTNVVLIDESLDAKVSGLAEHQFYGAKLIELCDGASRDDINGVAPKSGYMDHPLWAEGDGANFYQWESPKLLKYLLVHGFSPECILSQAGVVTARQS